MNKMITILLFTVMPVCAAAQSTVQLTGGSLNGQEVNTGILEMVVEPGASITGTISIETNNPSAPSNVAPLVLVWSWGAHESSFSTIDGWISDGISGYDIPIDMNAPATLGVYYFTFAFGLEMNGAQVASLTNWEVPGNPHWNDGHDIADWGTTEYEQSLVDHFVTTQYELQSGFFDRDVAAAMIKVTVANLPAVSLVSGGLNGFDVTDGILEITVEPGEPITGTVSIEAENLGSPSDVAPLVSVWNWGAHETSYTTVDGWIASGISSHDVALDLTAPATEGVYYITIAHGLELNGAQVASLTNWQVPGNPHWNDGHDIADWGSWEYNQSVVVHAVTTLYENTGGFSTSNVGAGMIKVTVVDLSTVDLLSGDLNQFGVTDGILEITVEPGEPIAGTVSIETDNLGSPTDVAPLVLVWNWGPHETSFITINGWISSGVSTHDVIVDLTAPAVEGVYYLTLAHALELNGAQVASLTNWQVPGNPHWNDGHDIADWGDVEYTESLLDLGVTTMYEGSSGLHQRKVAAAMIKVTVTDFSTVDLISGGLNEQNVSDGILEIDVDAGTQITGTVSIETDNLGSPSDVAPLVLVWNWGAHETSFITVDGWISSGVSSHDVNVDLVAPVDTGFYYLTIAHALELNGAQVASLTNWQVPGNPHWNDGHDIADWGDAEYTESLLDLGVTTMYEGTGGFHSRKVAAAMIKVHVKEPSAVDDDSRVGLPDEFSVSQNCPNPFNAITRIEYTLPRTSHVRIDIFNVLGQEVETLVDTKQHAGYHTVLWDSRNAASGLYFYRFSAGPVEETKKMLLIK